MLKKLDLPKKDDVLVTRRKPRLMYEVFDVYECKAEKGTFFIETKRISMSRDYNEYISWGKTFTFLSTRLNVSPVRFKNIGKIR